MTRERKSSAGNAEIHSSGASIFVTKKIKHNTFQYYAWKIAVVASLVVEHTVICWNLAKKLFSFLIAGTRVWVFMVARLFAFILILMPGWAALLRYYLFDSFIIRNIDYGKGPRSRNLLDVYLPQPNTPETPRKRKKGTKNKNIDSRRRQQGRAPVIVFVSGGAWIIGYKLWSGLMARELSRAGYVVIVPDYRNFPQGNIKDMIVDLRAALLWTATNCALFGGDPDQIILAGQSAGAHISLCVLVELYEEQLVRDMTRHFPHVSMNMSTRMVRTRSERGARDEECVGAQPQEADAEEEDNLEDCIWRDALSEANADSGKYLGRDTDECVDDDDGVDNVNSSDEEEHECNEDGGEVSLGVLATHCDHSQSPSLSSSSPCSSRLQSSYSFPFATNDLDFTEYSVSQNDDAGDEVTGNASEHMLEHARRRNSSVESYDDDYDHLLRVSDVKMFIGISGPYNMLGLMQHLHARGLDVSILHYIFAFDIKKYSPTLRLASLMGNALESTLSTQCQHLEESSLSIYKYLFGGAKECNVGEEEAKVKHSEKSLKHIQSEASIETFVLDQLHHQTRSRVEGLGEAAGNDTRPLTGFPSVALFHGSDDKSIPSPVSDELEALLLKGGVSVSSRIYQDMSHTDPILENVLEGNTELVVDMINVIERNLAIEGENDWSHAMETVLSKNDDGTAAAPAADDLHNAPTSTPLNSDRCKAYLHKHQETSWPISRGMMRIARAMNPF